MTKSLSLSLTLTHNLSMIILARPKLNNITAISNSLSSFPFSNLKLLYTNTLSSSLSFSTNSTKYPLQYDMIINRPTQSSLHPPRRRPTHATRPDSPPGPDSEPGFDSWVDRKLSSESEPMDKSKRKYYNKRRKRMFGPDSDEEEEKKRYEEGFVELRPQVVDFPRLHKREEELYFHDTFAYPWDKNRHYKMVYKLEKKYFPEHSLDKAFLEPGSESNRVKSSEKKEDDGGDDKVVFFEGEKRERESGGEVVSEKRVEEFFKCLKKVPNERVDGVVNGEPYLLSRSTELPPRWDSPNGTVVLINKPKGKYLSIALVS